MCTISFGERCRSIKVSVGWVFFNCNRTEWSAVWSEIICDFKIKRVHMESLIPNMISDQNYTTQSSVTEYLFITSVLKSQIHWLNEFFFVWSLNISLIHCIDHIVLKKVAKVVSHFPAIWLISVNWSLEIWLIVVF